MRKLIKLILLVFAGFVAVDILYKTTGNLFVSLLIGSILFMLYMRLKARR